MSTPIDWLNNSLKEVRHEMFKNVVKVSDVEVKPMGDGQLVIISDINRITMTLETSTGEKRKLKAIAKLEASTGAGKEFAQFCNAYDTEIMMYSDVLQSMEKLMMEVSDKNTLWPQCYYCGDNKFLLQDLSEVGYRVVPTHQFLDVEHAVLVMKALGKFHGLSMVMKERSILTKDSGIPYYARKAPFMDAMQQKSFRDLITVINEKWGPEWSSLPDRILKYFDKPTEKLHDSWNSTRGKWDVLNHGDFSMRNMLFHYPDGSSHPDRIKFVDFQMCHYSNLGNDLSTLLYSSIKPSVREENMESLLGTYVESLSSTVASYNYRGPVPSVKDVKQCLDSLQPIILITILLTVPMFVTSGKRDLQKHMNEYFEKYGTCEAIVEAQSKGIDPNVENGYNDEDVIAYLKYDLQRLMKNNII